MQKKSIFLGFLGLLCFLLLSPMTSLAQQYYGQYLASAFEPMDETYEFERGTTNYYFTHDGPSSGHYFHTVNFNRPVTVVLYIKSVSIRYYDSDSTNNLQVRLMRRNIFTNALHTVATWTSSGTPGWGIAHQATNDGYKLIDTQKFVYFLDVYFPAGSGQKLYFYQIRVHFGS